MKDDEDQIAKQLIDAINQGAIVDPRMDKSYEAILARTDVRAALRTQGLKHAEVSE